MNALTFAEMLGLWLDEVDDQASTATEPLRRQRSICERYLNPLLGSLALDQLTEARLEEYFAEVALRSLRPRTLQRHETILRHVISFGSSRGYFEGKEPKIPAHVNGRNSRSVSEDNDRCTADP